MKLSELQNRLLEMARRLGEVNQAAGFAGAEVTGLHIEDEGGEAHIVRLTVTTAPVNECCGAGRVDIRIGHVETIVHVERGR